MTKLDYERKDPQPNPDPAEAFWNATSIAVAILAFSVFPLATALIANELLARLTD